MTIDDAVKKLRQALRKLPGTEERPIARRNARKRVLGALRAVRAAVDETYPAIVRRRKVERVSEKTRMVRLQRAGWTPMSIGDAAPFAVAGVRIRRAGGWLWVPRWAAAIGVNPHELRKAQKSRAYQKSAIVREALLREV